MVQPPLMQVLNGTDLIAEGKIRATSTLAEKKESQQAAAEASNEEASDSVWPHAKTDTVDADAFYRDVSRTGITYGPCFRMVQKASTDGSQALMR